MEKPTTIGRAQSRDKSSGSPETFSPEMFEEDNPRDPSELKQIDILEKVTKKLLYYFFNSDSLLKLL